MDAFKLKGNQYFANKQMGRAVKEYNKGLTVLLSKRDAFSEEESDQLYRAQLPLRHNLALACLKLNHLDKAYEHASKSVKLEKNNSKSRYRLAQVCQAKGLLPQARRELEKAAKLDPTVRCSELSLT